MSPTTNGATYDGPLAIRKNTKLALADQVIEHHSAIELQSNLEISRKSYRKFYAGKSVIVLDTDQARNLSSVWRLSNVSRAIYSSAVQCPSAAFVSHLYEYMVNGRDGGYVVFMAGGGGSGKTAAVSNLLLDQPLLIYDTTFSHPKSAIKNVNLALDNKRSVVIMYVHRPFMSAVRGVIERAVLTGRTVPLGIMARDHIEAPKTVLQIARKFAVNNDVNIFVFDNSGNDPSEAKTILDREIVLSFLEDLTYNNLTDFERRAMSVLNSERDKGNVPEYILQALAKKI